MLVAEVGGWGEVRGKIFGPVWSGLVLHLVTVMVGWWNFRSRFYINIKICIIYVSQK
jgi:hypothetical protein